MQRDKANNIALLCLGYLVIRFWEKEIKTNLTACVERIEERLKDMPD